MVNTRWLVLCLTFFIAGCTKKTFKDSELMLKYLNEESNGYLVKKKIAGYDFSFMYKPTDLMVAQELDEGYTLKDVEKLRKKYGKYLYFVLSVSKNQKDLLGVMTNKNEFGRLVNEVAFGMSEKTCLYTSNRDTLELLNYISPRMYGMSKSTSFLFVYQREDQKIKESKDMSFVINDLAGKTGEVRFKIKTDEVLKQPQVLF